MPGVSRGSRTPCPRAAWPGVYVGARLTLRPADRLDRVNQRLQLLGVMDVGGGQLHRQRHAVPIHQDVVLAARLAAVGRVGPGPFATPLGPHADAVDAGAAPIHSVQVTQPVEHHLVDGGPDATVPPPAQAAPAGDAAAEAQFQWEVAPAEPVAQDEQDAAQGGAIRDARRAAMRWERLRGEQRLDRLPQIVADGVLRGHPRAYAITLVHRKGGSAAQ